MADQLHGLTATFDTPAAIMHAAEKVRDAGFRHWDVVTPFPVHGMDSAMGLKRSKVPRFTLVGGSCGFTFGMLMVWYMNAYDYPLIVGGKPFFSPMFAFPVAYELTILFAAFGSIIGMFLLNRLPMHYHSVLKSERIEQATNNRFLVVIEARDPNFHPERTRQFLAGLGGREIEPLED
jgi:hypothetical protein